MTANLCVKNPERTGGGVYFDMRYPKTGGGEDVSFCLTLKDLHAHGPRRQHPAVIAVPEATAQHPFWADIYAQVWLLMMYISNNTNVADSIAILFSHIISYI